MGDDCANMRDGLPGLDVARGRPDLGRSARCPVSRKHLTRRSIVETLGIGNLLQLIFISSNGGTYQVT